MKIQISDKRRLATIQKEFSTLFPYLKIEFFARPHQSGGASSKKLMKHGNKFVFECRTIHTTGEITVTPQMTVAELEDHFRDVFGLNVQVFRRSGKAWLETTVTDHWTLQEQNHQGRELSEFTGAIL
jgi:hypothetical protein